MSTYGKYNLYAILAVPILAALASIVVFGFLLDTVVYVFGSNLLPMLLGGLVSALLLKVSAKSGGMGQLIAVSPTLVPAAFGVLWYVFAMLPNDVDPGRHFFAGPLYLAMWVIAVSVIALIGCLVVRSSASSASA